ncbi:hypothetical protein FNA67_02930 [Youhaiella tibetensis]|uniref:Uncharacterized protein n=1 Tax=Paradevosia tibetensis TaxID=1447062 RepID=A0A5B9DKG6_9HYPH|nr:hypothetical protein [Youhaiella tibetensis]QEE19189.1 hypothetical protein FNA67_02930 [Youhaiella tibetensis]
MARAGSKTVSAYVKHVLFEGADASATAGTGLAIADRKMLSHLLATLGASRLAPNLDRLAGEAESGNLLADGETTYRLRQACDDVREMRNELMLGLGTGAVAPKHRSEEEILSGLFNSLNSTWVQER